MEIGDYGNHGERSDKDTLFTRPNSYINFQKFSTAKTIFPNTWNPSMYQINGSIHSSKFDRFGRINSQECTQHSSTRQKSAFARLQNLVWGSDDTKPQNTIGSTFLGHPEFQYFKRLTSMHACLFRRKSDTKRRMSSDVGEKVANWLA